MKRGLGFTIAWVGATAVAVIVAAAAVGSVRSQVTETPTALASPTRVALAAEPSETSPTPPGTPATTTTAAPAEVSAAADVTTTTLAPSDSPSTTAASSATSTTTTSSPSSTTIPPASETKSYSTAAGTVRIMVSGESVTFAGATADPGWTVELEKAGPPEVEVHFERNEGEEEEEIEFHAKFEDGELVVTISQV